MKIQFARQKTLRQFGFLPIMLGAFLLNACSNSNDSASMNFDEVDSVLENFVADDPNFDGAGIVIVDKNHGVVHQQFFGNFNEDTVIHLASSSKVPSSLVLLAIDEDESVDFDITTPMENYLEGTPAYPGVTVEHALSNTSGIPGLTTLFEIFFQHPEEILSVMPHICQYQDSVDFEVCNASLYQTRLNLSTFEDSTPGENFAYGGAQWQLAGQVATAVTGKSWQQLVSDILVQPCELQVFEYGNMFLRLNEWNGNPESLIGQNNPSLEGGAIANMHDYAKLLELQINGGYCGEHQVISQQALDFMRIDRGTSTGSASSIDSTADDGSQGQGYGLGLWIDPPDEGKEATIFSDPGAYGSNAWIDTEYGYGVYIMLEDPETISGSFDKDPLELIENPVGIEGAISDNPSSMDSLERSGMMAQELVSIIQAQFK